MKLFLLFLIIFIIGDTATALKKSHHGKSHQPHSHQTTTPNHQDSSSMMHKNETNPNTLHNVERKHNQHLENGKVTPKLPLSSNTSTTQPTHIQQGSPTPKKNLLQTKAEEHNVRDKKLNDQEGIQMENEYLIDVTPKPATPKKKSTALGHKKRSQNITEKGKQRKAMKEHSQSSGGVKTPNRSKQRKPKTSITATTKNNKKTNKTRKYPKKYNAQKHNIKKSPRQKDRKTLDKKREKREKLKEKRENKKKVRNQEKNN